MKTRSIKFRGVSRHAQAKSAKIHAKRMKGRVLR